MGTKPKPEKIAIDVDCRLAQSSIEMHKKTESSIIVTKFKTLYCTGLFTDYDQALEDVADSNCWVGLRTGSQQGLWITRVLSKDGEKIAELRNCGIKDINLNRSAEALVVGIKIQHEMSTDQPAIEAAVSTAVRLQLIKDEEAFETEV